MSCFWEIFICFQSFALIWATENAETEIRKPHMMSIPPNNHGIQPKVLIDEEIKVTKDKLLTIIPILSTEWSVSLNVRISSFAGKSAFVKVMRLTNNPKNDKTEYGVRTPSVALNTNDKKIRICSAVNGTANYIFTGFAFTLNQTYHLEIHQRYIVNGKYRYYIIVDGVEIHSVVNTDARQFYNVHAYASGSLGNPAEAYISNFKHVNFL